MYDLGWLRGCTSCRWSISTVRTWRPCCAASDGCRPIGSLWRGAGYWGSAVLRCLAAAGHSARRSDARHGHARRGPRGQKAAETRPAPGSGERIDDPALLGPESRCGLPRFCGCEGLFPTAIPQGDFRSASGSENVVGGRLTGDAVNGPRPKAVSCRLPTEPAPTPLLGAECHCCIRR